MPNQPVIPPITAGQIIAIATEALKDRPDLQGLMSIISLSDIGAVVNVSKGTPTGPQLATITIANGKVTSLVVHVTDPGIIKPPVG